MWLVAQLSVSLYFRYIDVHMWYALELCRTRLSTVITPYFTFLMLQWELGNLTSSKFKSLIFTYIRGTWRHSVQVMYSWLCLNPLSSFYNDTHSCERPLSWPPPSLRLLNTLWRPTSCPVLERFVFLWFCGFWFLPATKRARPWNHSRPSSTKV
jgi:hypothetical protein